MALSATHNAEIYADADDTANTAQQNDHILVIYS